MNDIRLALRQLTKSPGFALVAILTLALGIGANTAIFSVVDAVLLRPLPCPEQERLVALSEWSEQIPNMSISHPDFQDWRARQTSFTEIGISRRQSFTWQHGTAVERIIGNIATHDALAALAVSPLRGRLFTADDDKPGAARTVVLSESLWKRAFGGRDAALGEQMILNGQTYSIIGVLPASFRAISSEDVIAPLGLWADQFTQRWNHGGFYGIARLKPGVTFAAAQAEMKRIAGQLATEYPSTNAGVSVAMLPFTETVFGGSAVALWVLFGAAGFVLLIACANVANLQLARAHARGREFAIRVALGAGRLRVIRQLLTESLILGVIGSAAGILLAAWGLDAIQGFTGANLPRGGEIELNGAVLGFAVAVGLLTSALFGLAPALVASKQDLRSAFAASAGTAGTPAGRRWRTALIVGEFALTCLLLTGACLMLRTLTNLRTTNLGYTVENVVSFDLELDSGRFTKTGDKRAVIAAALERLRTMPAVKSAGVINPLPMRGGNQSNYIIEGRAPTKPGQGRSAERAQTDAGCLNAFGLALISGRAFTDQDNENAPRVAIVDTLFVERNFPGENPIGKRFTYGDVPPANERDWYHIIGVVPHVKNFGPRGLTREQTYIPYRQSVPSGLSFVLRTDRDVQTLAADIRAIMHDVAPDLPVFNIRSMEQRLDLLVSTERLTVLLLATFAGLALVLAAVGLYGVLSYLVGQRSREIGIRMSLGATARSVVELLVGQGMKMAIIGVIIGLVAAIALTRLLRSLLYEVSPFDPLTFSLAAAVLIVIGAAACWFPARRAARVNPVDVLRAE